MNEPCIISVSGRSGSGKTTLIEKLIKIFRSRGINVAVCKSMRHEFTMDQPGKDTYRYREAGAESVGITNGDTFALIMNNKRDFSPYDIVRQYFSDADLVLIEGYREGEGPKIEVIGDSVENPLFLSGVSNIRALVTDRVFDISMPVFKRDDVSAVADFILDEIRK